MVGCRKFFFSLRKQIYSRYSEFFDYQDESESDVQEGEKDSPKMDSKEATGRFYFHTFQVLTGKDITKWYQVQKYPLYLCLNHLASHKEEIIKENERIRNEQAQWRSTSHYKR